MASDVYALGLLLHELLTGTHPFEAAVSTPEDMQRAILEDSPAPPSLTAGRVDAAVAALRATTPGKLARHLRGRSEEHTSELQSLMRNSYAVFCLKNKTTKNSNRLLTD